MNKLHNQIASWDTKFETGAKTTLLQPFAPVVIASDENERIRYFPLFLVLVLMGCVLGPPCSGSFCYSLVGYFFFFFLIINVYEANSSLKFCDFYFYIFGLDPSNE